MAKKHRISKGMVLILSIVGVIGVVILCTFVYNQFTFSCEFRTTATQLRTTSAQNDISLRIYYLDRLAELHRQATSNDLIVLIYGFMSTILISMGVFLINQGQKNVNAIEEKYNELKADYLMLTNKHEKLVKTNKNTVYFHYASQILSDALACIMCYKSIPEGLEPNNEYLVQFKNNIRHISDLCVVVDFTQLNNYAHRKFLERIYNAEKIYVGDFGIRISSDHQESILRDFTKIKTTLSLQEPQNID